MKTRQDGMLNTRLLISPPIFTVLISGCTQPPQSCPAQPAANLSGAIVHAEDDQLDFRFPLDEFVYPYRAIFCERYCFQRPCEYHAAEDYHRPAGTPVYAMADGNIAFSGPMGGYGWLIIIDHPQANIYSLYGHLSPSRWRLESGPVEKGDLIAFLGDSDENGGSPDKPLETHLHFGVRAGQRADYPGMGEWRWQAGWIKPRPQDLGWLKPSEVITDQEIPPGGFSVPRAGLLEKWGVELALSALYLVGWVCALVFAVRRNRPILPALYGVVMIVAGWVLFSKGTRISYALFSIAVLSLVFAISQYVRHSRRLPTASHSS